MGESSNMCLMGNSKLVHLQEPLLWLQKYVLSHLDGNTVRQAGLLKPQNPIVISGLTAHMQKCPQQLVRYYDGK